MADTLTVLNPMGYPPKVTPKPLAPRLDSLDGKTVYLVDCRFDDSDIFLEQMQALVRRAHAGRDAPCSSRSSSVYTAGRPGDLGGDQGANGDAAIIGVGH